MSGGAGNDTYLRRTMPPIRCLRRWAAAPTRFMRASTTRCRRVRKWKFLRANAGATGLTLTGNEFNNLLVGLTGNDTLNGGDGNDALAGGDGNDTLNGGNGNDILNGQAGADLMSGGAGNDTYYVDNAVDKVFEAVGGGTDTVFANVNYALQAGQEVETLRANAGATGLILTGNEFNNLLVGLIGDAGNDTLNGGGDGNDTLNGGMATTSSTARPGLTSCRAVPAMTPITSTMPPIRCLRRWAAAPTRFMRASTTRCRQVRKWSFCAPTLARPD